MPIRSPSHDNTPKSPNYRYNELTATNSKIDATNHQITINTALAYTWLNSYRQHTKITKLPSRKN